MPSSADTTVAENVVGAILAMERSCLEVESALVERRFEDAQKGLLVQGLLTDELRRLFELQPAYAPASDPAVAKRIAGIYSFREEQLRRLRAYRDEVSNRLDGIARVRRFNRGIGRHVEPARHYDEPR